MENIDTLFEQYALVQNEIDILEEKKKELKTVINNYMQINNIEEQKTAWGKFHYQKRKVWSFPERITELELELKAHEESVNAEKELAKSNNEATCTENKIFMFTKAKI